MCHECLCANVDLPALVWRCVDEPACSRERDKNRGDVRWLRSFLTFGSLVTEVLAGVLGPVGKDWDPRECLQIDSIAPIRKYVYVCYSPKHVLVHFHHVGLLP